MQHLISSKEKNLSKITTFVNVKTVQSQGLFWHISCYYATWFNSIALRKAEIVFNFDLSECNRVKHIYFSFSITYYNPILTY